MPGHLPVAIDTQTMIGNFSRGAAGTRHFLEAGHTGMVEYSNGETMWGAYWAIIQSLNGFCLWVMWALITDLHSPLSHPSCSVRCLIFEQIENRTIKSNFSSSIGSNLFFTVSQSEHHSGGFYSFSLLHTNVHFPHTSSRPFRMHPQHFTAC